MKVAIQGQQGSFHHIAARRFFGDDVQIVGCDTFDDCFEAVKHGRADRAMTAIENSLYGSINQVYDLLVKHHFLITGEVYLRIEQCLIGLPGAKLADIAEVHSQIMALAECEAFLDEKLPQAKRVEQHDTSASVEMIQKWQDPGKAAIASRDAAELYGMDVLAAGIDTHKHNYTRFVVIEPIRVGVAKANKTSLVLSTPADTKPGALYRALGSFAQHNLNLTLLHSRPIADKAWHYLFYVDIAADAQTEPLRSAIEDLRSQGCIVTLLGTYRAGAIHD